MEFVDGKIYKLNPVGSYSKKYFKYKYGTENPEFIYEATDRKLLKGGWAMAQGNPAALLFAMRIGFDEVPGIPPAHYGHINGMGELVLKNEIVEILDDKEE